MMRSVCIRRIPALIALGIPFSVENRMLGLSFPVDLTPQEACGRYGVDGTMFWEILRLNIPGVEWSAGVLGEVLDKLVREGSPVFFAQECCEEVDDLPSVTEEMRNSEVKISTAEFIQILGDGITAAVPALRQTHLMFSLEEWEGILKSPLTGPILLLLAEFVEEEFTPQLKLARSGDDLVAASNHGHTILQVMEEIAREYGVETCVSISGRPFTPADSALRADVFAEGGTAES